MSQKCTLFIVGLKSERHTRKIGDIYTLFAFGYIAMILFHELVTYFCHTVILDLPLKSLKKNFDYEKFRVVERKNLCAP